MLPAVFFQQVDVPGAHTCKDCGEQFATSRENYYHMVEKHRDSLFKCPQCPSAFILHQSLLRHKQTHKKRPVADVEQTCPKCGLEFSSKEEKCKHMTEEHKENLFKCSQCPKVFIHKHSLTRHEKVPHGQQGNLLTPTDPTLCSGEAETETKAEANEPDETRRENSNARGNKPDENETDENKAKADDRKGEDIKAEEANVDETMAIKTEEIEISDRLPNATDTTLYSEKDKAELKVDANETDDKRCEATKADETVETKVDETKSKEIKAGETIVDERITIKTEELKSANTVSNENMIEDSKPDGIDHDENITKNKAIEMETSGVPDATGMQMDCNEESSFQNHGESHSEQETERVKISSMKLCNICGHHFDTVGKKEHHMLTAHTEPKFHCHMCSKPFFYSYHLDRHLKSHKNRTIPPEGKKVCSNKRKHTETDANKSKIIKTVAKAVDENETDKSKNVTAEIEDNERNANKDDNGENEKRMKEAKTTGSSANDTLHLLPCTLCDRKFDTTGKKEHHMLTAHTEPKFHCHMCSKPFFYRNHLRRHVISHEKQTLPLDRKKASSNKRKHRRKEENKSKVIKTDTTEGHKTAESKTGESKVDKTDIAAIEDSGKRAVINEADNDENNAGNKGIAVKKTATDDSKTKEKRIEEDLKTVSNAYDSSHLQPCTICGYVLKTPSQKSHHMVVAHSEPAFVCSICSKPFFYIYHLERHLAIHRKNATIRSAENKTENNGTNGNKASENVTDNVNAGQNKDEVIDDINDGSETEENKADEEGVEQSAEGKKIDYEADKTSMNLSQSLYNTPIVQTCVHCGLQFGTSRENYYHMVESHREFLFQCSQCPSAFYLEQSLIQHRRTHRKKKPSASKKKPMEMKEDATTFKCSQCPKSFDSKESLLNHGKRHQKVKASKNKPKKTKEEVTTFKCSQCPKTFDSTESLLNHQQRHQEVEEKVVVESQKTETKAEVIAFECSECPETFDSKEGLLDHEKSHQDVEEKLLIEGEQNSHEEKSDQTETKDSQKVKCGKCGLGFPSQRRKHYHEIIAHSDPKYKCAYCPKVFYFKTCLNRHHQTHKQQQSNTND